jgi:hypothetical protein
VTLAILGLILAGLAAGAAIGAHFGRKHGYRQGSRAAEIEVDHLRGELYDAEQQMNALRYFRRAA